MDSAIILYARGTVAQETSLFTWLSYLRTRASLTLTTNKKRGRISSDKYKSSCSLRVYIFVQICVYMLVYIYDRINGQEVVSIDLGNGHEESQV